MGSPLVELRARRRSNAAPTLCLTPSLWCAFAVALTLGLARPALADEPPHDVATAAPTVLSMGIFDATAAAPPDVDLWARVVDGRTWLSDPRMGPLLEGLAGRAVGAIDGDSRTPRGMGSLAQRLGMSGIDACDRYLGRDARFLLRGSGAQLDWALVTAVNEQDAERLLRQLRAVVRGGGLYSLPEEGLAVAYRDGWMVVGRGVDADLFVACRDRLLAPAAPSLRETLLGAGLGAPSLASLGGETKGAARLAIAFHGPAPIAGWSVLAIDATGNQLHGALRGAYAQPPLPGGHPSRLDLSLLDGFDGLCLGAQIDPIATEIDPGDAFLLHRFPALLRSPAARANLGATRLILIGEADGANAKPPLAMRCPAIALAYEVDDPDAARQDQDRLIAALVEHEIKQNGSAPAPGAAASDAAVIPPVALPSDGKEEGPRRYDASALVARVIGDHPLVRSMSLNWQTVRCGDRSWQVYATHPEWLKAVTAALATAPKVDRALAERPLVTSAGVLNGERVAAHLRSWVGEAKAFQREQPAEFARGIELIAAVAERFGSVRWSMNQPTPKELTLDLSATLAAPPTAAPKR